MPIDNVGSTPTGESQAADQTEKTKPAGDPKADYDAATTYLTDISQLKDLDPDAWMKMLESFATTILKEYEHAEKERIKKKKEEESRNKG